MGAARFWGKGVQPWSYLCTGVLTLFFKDEAQSPQECECLRIGHNLPIQEDQNLISIAGKALPRTHSGPPRIGLAIRDEIGSWDFSIQSCKQPSSTGWHEGARCGTYCGQCVLFGSVY
jgi:hypothetical protein